MVYRILRGLSVERDGLLKTVTPVPSAIEKTLAATGERKDHDTGDALVLASFPVSPSTVGVGDMLLIRLPG